MIFTTAYHSQDAGSVLHSGIYNREFSSMLASMAAAVVSYPLITFFSREGIALYGALFIVAVLTFPLFRKYVFRGKTLKAVFDLSLRRAEFFQVGLTTKKTGSVPIDRISRLMIEKKTPEIRNPDGVEFVKKISLQHGSVIPGFGDETPFFLLKLGLSDCADRVLYSDRAMDSVLAAYDGINGFLRKYKVL